MSWVERVGVTMYKLPIVIAIGLFAASCSSSEEAAGNNILIEGDDDITELEVSSDDEALALEFAACMRENGVDIADPTVNADGSIDLFGGGGPGAGGNQVDAQARRSAFEECGDIIAEASFFGNRGGNGPDVEQQDTILALAQCLRDNGFTDVEDPTFDDFGAGGAPALGAGGPGGGRGGGLFGDSIDFQDEAVQETLALCRTEAGIEDGQGGPGGGGFGGRRGGGAGRNAAAN